MSEEQTPYQPRQPVNQCGSVTASRALLKASFAPHLNDREADLVERAANAHGSAQMATVGPKRKKKGENGHRAAVDGAFQHFRIPGQPIGKPRMTRSDKWRVRDCVAQYRAWADRARASCPGIMAAPGRLNFTAYLAMPPSWSRKKKAAMTGQPHRQKPDVDNIAKAVMDALWKDDSGIHSISCSKLWCDCERAGIELHVEA